MAAKRSGLGWDNTFTVGRGRGSLMNTPDETRLFGDPFSTVVQAGVEQLAFLPTTIVKCAGVRYLEPVILSTLLRSQNCRVK